MSSDSEEETEVPSWQGVAGTVILINTFDPLQLGTPGMAYEAAFNLMRGYMRTNSSQLLGVSFFGTKTSNVDVEGIHQVFPLSVATLDDFKKLENTQVSSIEPATELKLSDVLWYCNKMFASCKKLLASKTVLMLSRLDIAPLQADQKPSLKRVVDIVDSNIYLKLINISKDEYIVDKFYEIFLTEINKGNEYKIPPRLWGIEDITNQMLQNSHRHLALARLPFDIGADFTIGVAVYSLLQSQTKPKKVTVNRENNQIVTSVTKTFKLQHRDNYLDTENGMEVEAEGPPKEVPLLKSEKLYYQQFGEERIEFTAQEMKYLKNAFGPPKMTMLGFKPAATLSKSKWFMKKCNFLYPCESLIEGSTVAFKALHQACLEMSVIAICMLNRRVNSRPALVALSPSTKPFGQNITIGFDVIYIPFVENVRNVPGNDECDKSVDETHKILMKDVTKSCLFDYKSSHFENPALQYLHVALEALALEKSEVDPIEDTTKSDDKQFNSIDHELIEEMFGPFSAKGAKRMVQMNSDHATKRLKPAEIDQDLLESRINDGKVNKYTVAELKDILRSKNIENLPALTGVLKTDLVKLVLEHFRT